MFGGGGFPDPMGGGGGGNAPTGDGFAVVSVVADIIPVRIVNSNALDVRVMNFPGVPPPLPGLKSNATPPPLPGAKGPPIAPKAKGIGLNELGLGNIAKLATVAGLAAAGIGLVWKAFDLAKSLVIDPLLGAAHGGLSTGVARGTGSDTLTKSFVTLGIVLGSNLLPIMLDLAVAALELADQFNRTNRSVDEARKRGEQMGDTFDNAGKKIDRGAGDTRSWLDQLDDWSDRQADALNLWGKSGQKITESGKGSTQVLTEEQKKRKEFSDMVKASLMQSQGAQAGFVGVADIRAQAQMAAFQDPLEALARRLTIEGFQRLLDKGIPSMETTAKNTAPPGGNAQ